jgi:hypothetical protein
MALKVDTGIAYGNACDVSIGEERGMPVVSFAAGTHGGPECLWFCFRLLQTATEARPVKVKLVLKHFYNMLGAGNALAVRPVMKSADGDWVRLGAGTAEELPDGRLQLAWSIDLPGAFVDVAFCYPYGRAEVEALVRETKGYWQAQVIGVSQGARQLVRLSNAPGKEGGERPGLYLVARQHSGETPGSWVLDGFLRRMAEAGEAAPLVWAVPLTNVDGVEQGDYGKDNFPYDLNRAWGKPPMRHEVLVYQRDMDRWKKRCQPVLGIDFHAPGACETDGLYCYLPRPDTFPQQHDEAARWAEALAHALTPDYAADDFKRVAKYASRWETPGFSSYCCSALEMPALSIEAPYALVRETVLTRKHYQEAGARLAAAVGTHLEGG